MGSENTVRGASHSVNEVISFKVDEAKDIFEIKKNERDIKNQVISALWNIFSVIVFPVGLCRLLIGRVAVPMAALPAVAIFRNPAIKKEAEDLYNSAEVNRWRRYSSKVETPKKITVTTADDVELDTVAIINRDQESTRKEDQKWILYLNGNAGCYEASMEDLIHTSFQTGANIYTGNYRGVMNSKGYPTSSKDLVVDAEAMVQYLLSEGVKSENILVHGWSLGGAVAAEVVSRHQEEGHYMHLCTERSFSTFQDTLEGMIGKIGVVAGKIAWLAGWRFDSGEKIKKINGEKLFMYAKNDKVIDYQKAAVYKKEKVDQMDLDDKILKVDRNIKKIDGKINNNIILMKTKKSNTEEIAKKIKNLSRESDDHYTDQLKKLQIKKLQSDLKRSKAELEVLNKDLATLEKAKSNFQKEQKDLEASRDPNAVKLNEVELAEKNTSRPYKPGRRIKSQNAGHVDNMINDKYYNQVKEILKINSGNS